MSLYTYRDTDNIKVTQMKIVGTQIESGKTVFAIKVQGREIEHGPFAGISHKASSFAGRSCLLKCKHVGVGTLVFHYLLVGNLVSASAKIHSVARYHLFIGCGQRGQRCIDCSRSTVVSTRSYVDTLGRNRNYYCQ